MLKLLTHETNTLTLMAIEQLLLML